MTTEPTRPADPFSIFSLAAGVAAMVYTLFSLVPMVGFCTFPLSFLCALTSVITGVVSLLRTTANPALEGRYQALMGLGLSALWCGAALLLFVFVSRSH